jgi:hypothetical protein
MSLGNALIEQILQMAGAEAPLSVAVSHADRTAGATLQMWSPLAVSLQEVRVSGAPSVELSASARKLAARISYLAEPITFLEIDDFAREAQLRSCPPKKIENGVEYFEVRMSQSGEIALRRYRQIGDASRCEIPAPMTLETLARVVDDLAAPM